MSPGEPKPRGQPLKDMLGKQTQINALNQLEKKIKMNESVANTDNLKAISLEVVQSLTTALRMRLDKFQDLIQMRPKTDLATGSSVRPVHELAKFATKISNKMYEPKIYNEAIDDSIHGNR